MVRLELTTFVPNSTMTPAAAVGSTVWAKVACCLILLLSTGFLVFLPIWVRRCCGNSGQSWRNQAWIFRLARAYGLSAMNCLAGGVFFGTALLHILVDAQEELQEGLEAAKVKTSFPVANALVLVGIVLIMSFEQLTSFVEQKHRAGADEESQNLLPNNRGSFHAMRVSNQSRESEVRKEQPNSSPPLNSLILVLAVSVHSIFEGLAIGLQTASSAVFSLLFAVSFHKVIVTISVGVQLAQVKSAKFVPVLFGVIYSCAAPLGVFIGSLVADNTNNLTVGILQSLACGTFIYVAAFEILPEELRDPKRWRLLCVVAFTMGVGLVVLINILFPDEEHGH